MKLLLDLLLNEGKTKTPFDIWAKEQAAANRAKKKEQADAAKHVKKELIQLNKELKKLDQPTKLTSDQIWSKVETIIGNTFPDGDPIDHLIPWMEKNKITMDQINAAVKKHTKAKDMYAYLATFWDQCAADALHDATEMLKRGKVPDYSPFISVDNLDKQGITSKERVVKNLNPWK